MKKILMFVQKTCPYCRAAREHMRALAAEDARFAALEIETVDELAEPERAAKYDYFYVPTFYVGCEKVHEGAADGPAVREVFEKALKD